MFIIIFGNPVDGFKSLGPFENDEDALDYAEHMPGHVEWWIQKLIKPLTS